MHFDPRTQEALREVGLDTERIRRASDIVTESVRRDARELAAFFDDCETVYSDMDVAHGASDIQKHTVDHLDLYTHGADMRGYLRFDTWGVYVEDGRILSDTTVELSLGPTVHDRVRFSPDPEML
ncbi:MAG: DUF7532 family protein [Halobacteriota archaeon]